jgi:tRNA threonylcarbamoyladenosine biosynthesis protein TsaE
VKPATPLQETAYTTNSAEETIALGEKLGAGMRPPRLVLLIGDLGAGKTTLTKGIIRGLGVAGPDDVLSPTFSLIHEYEGPPKVYHIDLYRLDRVPELETLGLDDLWDQQAVVLIEWGEKFTDQLPGPRLEIHLQDKGDETREIRVRTSQDA